MTADDYALKPLPYGPVALAGAFLIGGYVILVAYQAWRQGQAFVTPVRDFLAMLICVAFFSVVAYMFVGKPNEGADILIGALIAAFSAIVIMYFKPGDKP